MSILFISNENPFESLGGAGQNSLGLIEILESKGASINFVIPNQLSENDIILNDAFILEDFWGINEDILKLLFQEKYFIFENSFGFARDKFLGFIPRKRKWIEDSPVHLDIYENAHTVFLQSWFQYAIFECNVPELDNLVCLDGNFWPEEKMDKLVHYSHLRNGGGDIYSAYQNKYLILDGKNDLHKKVKGVQEAIEYAEAKGLNYKLVRPTSFEEYLNEMVQAEGLIFLPSVPETFSRVYLEAKYMNLHIISNDNIGMKRSYWESSYLPNKIAMFRNLAGSKVWDQLNQ